MTLSRPSSRGHHRQPRNDSDDTLISSLVSNMFVDASVTLKERRRREEAVSIVQKRCQASPPHSSTSSTSKSPVPALSIRSSKEDTSEVLQRSARSLQSMASTILAGPKQPTLGDVTLGSIIGGLARRLQEEQADMEPMPLLPQKPPKRKGGPVEACPAIPEEAPQTVISSACTIRSSMNQSKSSSAVNKENERNANSTRSSVCSTKEDDRKNVVVHDMGPKPPSDDVDIFHASQCSHAPMSRPMSAFGPRTPHQELKTSIIPIQNFACPKRMNLQSRLLMKNQVIPESIMCPSAARLRSHQSWSSYTPHSRYHGANTLLSRSHSVRLVAEAADGGTISTTANGSSSTSPRPSSSNENDVLPTTPLDGTQQRETTNSTAERDTLSNKALQARPQTAPPREQAPWRIKDGTEERKDECYEFFSAPPRQW